MWPDHDRPLFFDRQGRPIDVLAWAQKFEDRDYRFIAEWEMQDWRVATIWIGLDNGIGFLFGAPPAIFETAVFSLGAEDSVYDGQARYATEEAARAGHDQAVAWVTERLGLDSAGGVPGRDRETPC